MGRSVNMHIVHLYVYRVIEGRNSASSALYTDVRQVRKFYDCIRNCLKDIADVSLTETKDGFRIEVRI